MNRVHASPHGNGGNSCTANRHPHTALRIETDA